jgi:hypothetical protein
MQHPTTFVRFFFDDSGISFVAGGFSLFCALKIKKRTIIINVQDIGNTNASVIVVGC